MQATKAPRPVAADAGQVIGPSQDSIIGSVLLGIAGRTGMPTLELSGAPHGLAYELAAVVGTLAELLAADPERHTLLWQGCARRAVKALNLERQVLEQALRDRPGDAS